ncbi:hypothetical protein [Ferrovibrio sp.]|uniref:hypothetical protein n=1 Tax=Ferrovibrio sp. TaxID=1917215 RepID=UPI003D12B033
MWPARAIDSLSRLAEDALLWLAEHAHALAAFCANRVRGLREGRGAQTGEGGGDVL